MEYRFGDHGSCGGDGGGGGGGGDGGGGGGGGDGGGGGSGGGSGGGGVYIVCMYECMYSIYVVFIMYAWMWNVPRDCDHYIASSSHRYIF